LRRAMAAWRRRGGLGAFEERLVEGMRTRGYTQDFARQVFNQIQGFGEYGFPESHSASFALLVYVSCWLKHHEPAAFTCSLLNSQPMGFYAPAQLVQDLRRHDVEVRPVDVLQSDWDCTLEPGRGGEPALRLGLRMVKGLQHQPILTFLESRTQGGDMQSALRDLGRRQVKALAAAGALDGLSEHRRLAGWQALGLDKLPGFLEGAGFTETQPDLPAPNEAENLLADYGSIGLTLGRHPMALLRPRLHKWRTVQAAALDAMPHGRFVRVAGLVINRQRPGTASGVIFMTLEDETGSINVVLWPWVVQQQRRLVIGSRLLRVHGKVERQGRVIHVIGGHLFDHSEWLGRLRTRSRDFH